eukprot:scaffold15108_cov180-Amphora_coffeaeformis.AAC.101
MARGVPIDSDDDESNEETSDEIDDVEDSHNNEDDEDDETELCLCGNSASTCTKSLKRRQERKIHRRDPESPRNITNFATGQL